MMKSNFFIVASFVLCMLVSCQQEFTYDPFESSENGMPRYLAKIVEVTYIKSGTSKEECQKDIFSNPVFDGNGKLQNAYVNFIGREANNTYKYEQDKIMVQSMTRDDERYVLNYTLNNGLIIKCEESSKKNGKKSCYAYSYDSNKCLREINVNMDNFYCDIIINWHNGNMMSVKVLYERGDSSIYSFEYTQDKKYRPIFPSFWTSCFEIGGVYGVDAILSCQGYFGKNISEDLISKEYFNGQLSRRFKYKIDTKGCVTDITDIDSNNKEVRKYILKWK